MDDKTNPGNAVAPTGADNAGNATSTAEEIARLQAELKAEREQHAKDNKDKEIYRAATLTMKAQNKRKLTAEEVADPEKLTNFIEEKANEKLAEKEAHATAQAEAERVEKLERENAELRRLAEAQRATGGVGGGTSPANSPEVRANSYFSDDQKNELRKIYRSRGFHSEAKLEEMVKTAERLAKERAATQPITNSIVPKRTH